MKYNSGLVDPLTYMENASQKSGSMACMEDQEVSTGCTIRSMSSRDDDPANR